MGGWFDVSGGSIDLISANQMRVVCKCIIRIRYASRTRVYRWPTATRFLRKCSLFDVYGNALEYIVSATNISAYRTRTLLVARHIENHANVQEICAVVSVLWTLKIVEIAPVVQFLYWSNS